ncbi:MAG: cell division protein FtsI/penicillin-binding protein 2 [Actinomycetia bacterium]|nr:cell division protein FtsI/penicillin-binding protein 2 [Actinomycetes bacterium]
MNRGIRRVGTGILVLFLAIVGQLTYLQVFRSNDLKNNPNNVRAFIRDINRPRGPIITADGAIVADSKPTKGELKQQREYPLGSLFSHVVGYQSIVYGTTGVERTYNNSLVGSDVQLSLKNLGQLLNGQSRVGTVVLTLSKAAQQAAHDGLAGKRGSVVALNVKTGGVVAMYSEPSFDPNPLANHNSNNVQKVQQALLAAPDNPELPRAWRERYPAGSTFKVVTTSLALDDGIATPDRVFPTLRELPLPQTNNTLQNFGGEICGGTLEQSFTVSCNTTFGALGLELGEQLASGVERFGLNVAPPPADISPSVIRSLGPTRGTFKDNQPVFAQAAIGQNAIEVTPLEMAMIAASVGNGGKMMVPHVVSEVRDAQNRTVRRIPPQVWRQAMTPATATTVTRFMVNVVDHGTGTAAQIPGVVVAGKTGTAQVQGKAPHAWFVAFAPAANPQYAVAVLVENGGNLGSDATGGRVAAPIAAQVLRVLLAQQPQ